MVRAFIGIGSNIDPANNVLAAIRILARRVNLVAVSTVYLTDALDRPEQEPYYNCVAEIGTDAQPAEVRNDLLRPVESELGRRRTEDKYAARTIDLDLILYGNLEMEAQAEGLHLPDPDILKRPFLALPLFELAPDLVLPGYGLRIADIAAALPQGGMKPLKDYSLLLKEEVSRRLNRGENP
jgi:2-amino-4-hydroxy-6-hydroxymethyldihydropteridine diphosphokinase